MKLLNSININDRSQEKYISKTGVQNEADRAKQKFF